MARAGEVAEFCASPDRRTSKRVPIVHSGGTIWHMAALAVRTIADALGGRKALRVDVRSQEALLRSVESGLPYRSLEALSKRFGLARNDVANALRVPLRTLARRKREGKLNADESDRLLRLARVAAEAARVLAGERNAGLWLTGRIVALGGERPIDLLRTDLGAHEVEAILGHIEYGIVS